MNFYYKVLGTIIFGLMFVNHAHACAAPPLEYTTHHTELVRNTANIVLARAIGPSKKADSVFGGRKKLAKFVTLEIIKGTAPSMFTIDNGFFSTKSNINNQDFDRHTKLGFWEKNSADNGMDLTVK